MYWNYYGWKSDYEFGNWAMRIELEPAVGKFTLCIYSLSLRVASVAVRSEQTATQHGTCTVGGLDAK